jgi:hypothetical protein
MLDVREGEFCLASQRTLGHSMTNPRTAALAIPTRLAANQRKEVMSRRLLALPLLEFDTRKYADDEATTTKPEAMPVNNTADIARIVRPSLDMRFLQILEHDQHTISAQHIACFGSFATA